MTSMRGGHRRAGAPRRRHGAAAFPDVRLVLIAERLDRREYGRRRGIAERAERLAEDVVGDRQQEIDIARLAFTALDLPQHPVEPVAALPARRALPARLVFVEME